VHGNGENTRAPAGTSFPAGAKCVYLPFISYMFPRQF